MSCIDLETLVAYWLDELAEGDAFQVEQHFLGCAHCAGRLEWVAACAGGVRAAVREGAAVLAITPRFLDAMKRSGLRVREYSAQPGATVHCTIAAEDDAVVSRLAAPLAGARRVDVLHSFEAGERKGSWRVEDVPFVADAGEVLLTHSTPVLRAMPSHTHRVRLVAVDESGDRPLGEYVFAHTAA